MSVNVITEDSDYPESNADDGETDKPVNFDKCAYVDGEKVKYDFVDSNSPGLKNGSLFKNCCSLSMCSDEVNGTLEIANLPSDEVGDVGLLKCSRIETINQDEESSLEANETVKLSDSFKKTPSKVLFHIKKKRKKILAALANGDTDFLREAAESQGGLLSDDIRRKIWPKLVGVDVFETSPRPSREEIEDHPYYRQVVLDVNRSLKRFPPSIKEVQRLAMLDQLVLLIMRVLCRHPEMHYYQGYHDICVTFLLVLGEELAYYVVEKLSCTHLRVFMEQTMEPTIHLLEYMYLLINKKDSQLATFLYKSEVGVAFCLSWLITWFGHVLNDYDSVVRLFDLFIVCHPWMPMYLTTAIVLHRESEILEQECDMACVHSLLSKVPDDLPFESLILQSLELYQKFDPKTLSRERPYKSKVKTKWGGGLIHTLARTIRSSVPASNFTVPLVIAAAVLVSAVIYQAYKY